LTSAANHFRLCSICRSPIAFRAEYFACNVSTCNRTRMALTFCSLGCFEAHVPGARHRDAWAEARTAPSAEEHARSAGEETVADPPSPKPTSASARGARIVAPARGTSESPARASGDGRAEPDREVLVVVSKVKKYVRDVSGMNTSDGVADVLSDHLRDVCREALRHAARDDRRTVLDRDVLKALRER
jgi:hypothetical protein